MSARKHSPKTVKRAVLGRLSKSASELSCTHVNQPVDACNPDADETRERARSSVAHTATAAVVHRTQHFFTSLRSRWSRSRSRERYGQQLSVAQQDTSGTDSSNTPANSPRHNLRNGHQPSAPMVRTTVADLLTTQPEIQAMREHQLRQYESFQLRIHLKRGEHLQAMDKNGTSDPYVKFKSCGRLLYKSRIVHRDLNPVWDETFTVQIDDPFQPLHVKVLDYDWGLQDDFLGCCYLELSSLELGRSKELSLALHDPTRHSSTSQIGRIVLAATLWPKSHEDRDQCLLRATRQSEMSRRLKSQIWSSVVTIVLVEAKDLKPIEGEQSQIDSYVKFRLSNEKYKSKVVWKSEQPSWLEQFDLHLYEDQEQILEVTVWNKDKQTKDEFLGRCSIDLTALEREKTHNLWSNLEEGSGKIFLLLTISGTTHSETITDLTAYHESRTEIEAIEDKFRWYKNIHGSGIGWLRVKVFGAKGLAAADLGGKSDPFCVLELTNMRLQTHTEYKTLAPSWMKIFTFTVKDITSVLELTVYDEDSDHKVEFLGKLCIPVLRIRNGVKRWYCLKDKKMRARAKGNNPQIQLEMMVIWNPLKAAIRCINPKEQKYMQLESKFKRHLFIRNVMRLKAIIMWFIDFGKILQDCFEWESRILSFIGLLCWLVFCYNFRPWMGPLLILGLFARSWLIFKLTGGNQLLLPVDDDDLLAEEDDDEVDTDKQEEKKSLKERLVAIQEVTQSVQNAIGFVASLGEQVKNLVNFTVPYLSYLAIIMLIAASIVLFMIPLRYLLMAWGINKFTRKILRPHTIPNNEVLDLLSRVPDDEILLDCRELKPQLTSDARLTRKKYKPT